MLLEIVDLSVHYGTGEALKGVSLKVDEGSVISIVGANGAGKTTILRSISGLKRPTSGEIWFQGKRIDGLEVRDIVKRGIAHVPEGKMIFSPLTVLENLKLGAFLRNDQNGINRDLDVMYEYFPVLKEKRRHSAGDLSGGQQQMLAVARAMMAAPKLLLMDEPTTGLSPILVAKVGEIITNINKSGTSIILVEQNARMALKLSKRAYILEVGNVIIEGDAAELINSELVKKAYLGGAKAHKERNS